jgi:pyruvate dehydrogenase E1 component
MSSFEPFSERNAPDALPDPAAYWRVIAQDVDPAETTEWLTALDDLVREQGAERASFMLRKLLDHARDRRIKLPPLVNTPYRNSIALERQAAFPGNLLLEQRVSAIVRWNALAMVVRANNFSSELGGHIATYASAADLFETGFNHCFKADHGQQRGDLVYFQAHSAPGVYARAYLEGRLSEARLQRYRRETVAVEENAGNRESNRNSSAVAGLSSYPHPWLMPDFWQFPTGSMGLGPLQAIYQARFLRYLGHRGLIDAATVQPGVRGRKVWAFVGDGEMDEPESLAGLSLAAREGLDNLVFVVNCNLQRLDGPVRGNGSIVQELEGLFAGAGWNVIKLMWGSDWDPLFARDQAEHGGVLLKRLHETVDGAFQTYAATDGRFNRENFFNKYKDLRALIGDMSDADIDRLRRGGHDPLKIYAAYHAALRHTGQPTVILAQTKKGYGMGPIAQGKMGTHQQKKLDHQALLAFRDRFDLPLSDEDTVALRFYKPAEDSAEMKYLHAQRQRLGGYLPARRSDAPALAVPALSAFSKLLEGSAGREQSTTTAFVQILAQLLKEPQLGARVVPIVADEARTFGMQTLFRQVGIYSSVGQLYEPEDHDELLYYKEARDGQILEEGISEAGAMASWIAAATSYSTHGLPMLPFYIYYSIFGFQRIGDLAWAAGDSRARGFLIGGTAGRTTLSGEGLQHQDGSSHLIAATIPNCVAYDPCFAYELAVIVQEGMRRMLQQQEDVFYYVTVMNENYAHPAMPGGIAGALSEAVQQGIRRGMYCLQPVQAGVVPALRLLGSGTILREVLVAAQRLQSEDGLAVEVWSVTSFSELQRDGLACESQSCNTQQPASQTAPQPAPRPWITQCLATPQARSGNKATAGDTAIAPIPTIAATDYVRALPELVRAWVPGPYLTLGTDGYGRSDTRAALRAHFQVDAAAVVAAARRALQLRPHPSGSAPA